MFRSAHGSTRAGFTLIELLVVIAIIAILAAILFPVFAQAKLAAKKSAGLTQMKQMATAVIMYATDYDDGIPTWNECFAGLHATGVFPGGICSSNSFAPEVHWDAKISPYVKNGQPEVGNHNGIWQSPGREYQSGRSIGINQLAMWDTASTNNGGAACSWGVHTNRFRGCYYYLNLGRVSDPVNTMFTADAGRGGRYEPMYFLNGYAERFVPTYAGYGQYDWGQPWRYGKDGANYTWLDGHARFFKGDAIYSNPNRQPTLAFPAGVARSLHCNVVKYQAATDEMKSVLRTFVQNTYGTPCTD